MIHYCLQMCYFLFNIKTKRQISMSKTHVKWNTNLVKSFACKSPTKSFTNSGKFCHWLVRHWLCNEISVLLRCSRHFLFFFLLFDKVQSDQSLICRDLGVRLRVSQQAFLRVEKIFKNWLIDATELTQDCVTNKIDFVIPNWITFFCDLVDVNFLKKYHSYLIYTT